MRAEWLSEICSDIAARSRISIAKLEKDPSQRIDGSKGHNNGFGSYKKQFHKQLLSGWGSLMHPKTSPSSVHAL